MKKIVFLLALGLTACGNKHDISKVKIGMTGKQVEAIMGTPDEKVIKPVNQEWWQYGENQLIVIQTDTVKIVVPDVSVASEDIKRSFAGADSALKEIFDATKGIAR
ncbi:MAG: hypothetical protein JWO06_865 [Bacteroidota bacterium]|nr:hypothetical protein [Bacteroidota bacterium]